MDKKRSYVTWKEGIDIKKRKELKEHFKKYNITGCDCRLHDIEGRFYYCEGDYCSVVKGKCRYYGTKD